MQEVAKEALSRLSDTGIQITQHAMPTFQDLYPTTIDPSSPFDAAVEMPVSYDMSATSIIMHSSGVLFLVNTPRRGSFPCRVYGTPENGSLEPRTSQALGPNRRWV